MLLEQLDRVFVSFDECFTGSYRLFYGYILSAKMVENVCARTYDANRWREANVRWAFVLRLNVRWAVDEVVYIIVTVRKRHERQR